MNPDKVLQIRAENEKKADIALRQKLHQELLDKQDSLQEELVHVFEVLLKYLNGATLKTKESNPITTIATPDVKDVVTELKAQTKELIDNQADLTELKTGLDELATQLKELPREYPEFPELPTMPDTIDVPGLLDAVKDLKKAIDDKELSVTAPDVHVAAPNVKVAPTDLKPLQDGLGKLLSATKLNKPKAPEKINLKKLEAGITKANEYLKKISEKKGGGGGGGGGGSTFQDSTGKLVYPTLNPDGTLPINISGGATVYKLLLDDTTTANVTYIGKAALGTATSAASWQIQRLDETTGLVVTWGGTGAFDQVWNNRATTVVYA